MKVDLTPGQLRAILSALVETVDGADWQQQLATFGSPSGARAAARARDRVTRALADAGEEL